MKKIINGRMREPSTWAGLAGVLEGLKMLAPQYAPIIMGMQAIAGGVAVMVREKGAYGGQ